MWVWVVTPEALKESTPAYCWRVTGGTLMVHYRFKDHFGWFLGGFCFLRGSEVHKKSLQRNWFAWWLYGDSNKNGLHIKPCKPLIYLVARGEIEPPTHGLWILSSWAIKRLNEGKERECKNWLPKYTPKNCKSVDTWLTVTGRIFIQSVKNGWMNAVFEPWWGCVLWLIPTLNALGG